MKCHHHQPHRPSLLEIEQAFTSAPPKTTSNLRVYPECPSVEQWGYLSACWAAGMSHSLIVESRSAEASVLPSGVYATDFPRPVKPVCPWKVACSLPVLTSH